MAVEFNKVDAALFAIEGFISRLLSHNDNLSHADYYLSMTRHLRGSIAWNILDEAAQAKRKDASIQQKLRTGPDHRIQPLVRIIPSGKKKRPADKGQMSLRQRQAISKKMKTFWAKKRGKR